MNTRPPFQFEVKSYRKSIIIGCADDEQVAPQEVVFDIVASVQPKATLLMDVWEPEFDYCVLTDAVDAACAHIGVKILQEPLAFDVMSRIFESHALINELDLMTRKTQRYSGTDYIGFRMSLNRAQWLALRAEIEQQHLKHPKEATA
jgi:dihydroneopterin aldolase